MPAQTPAIILFFLLLKSLFPLISFDFIIFSPIEFENIRYNKAPTKWNKDIINSQHSFWEIVNLDVKQLKIAQIQNINKNITNKKIKTIIHKGKNQNPNAILQNNIRF